MRNLTGQELKRLRKMAGLTAKEAAELSMTPLSTWNAWEVDSEKPSHRKPPGMAFAVLGLYIKYALRGKPFPVE